MPDRRRTRRSCPTRYGLSAARGRWLGDGTTFVVETQTLGNDDVARVTFVFGDRAVDVNFEAAAGYKTTLKGRTDD